MIYALQHLRAVAASAVVLYHAESSARFYLGFEGSWILQHGHLGVDIFFVLSGFIILFMVVHKRQERSDFIINRLSRIVPPYWLLTIIFIVLALGAPILSANPDAQGSISRRAVLSFTFLTWIDVHSPALVYVGWSLSYELIFYTIVVLLYPWLQNNAALRCARAALPVVALLVWIAPFIRLNTAIFSQFYFGAIIFLIWSQRLSLKEGVFILSCVGVILMLSNQEGILYGAVLGAVGVSFCLWLERQGSSLVNNRILLAAGKSSYSMYLMQVFVLPAVNKVFLLFGSKNLGELYIIIGLLSCLLIGYAFYRLIEKPLYSYVKAATGWFLVRRPVISV